MPVSIARRSLHAAATDPHTTLRAIAQTGDAELFDLLLDRTHIKVEGGWQILADPYLTDPLTLRALVALAPADSGRAQALRASLTDLLLRGDTAEPSSDTLRYLDRFPSLRRLRLEGMLHLLDWEALAGHPALSELELELCGVCPGDWGPLARTRLQRLEVRGTHPLAAPVCDLSVLSRLDRLHTLHLRGLPHLTALPDLSALRLDELRLVDLPALDALPPLPAALATLWAPGRAVATLPPSLRRVHLVGPTPPGLSFPDALEHLGLLLAPGPVDIPELPGLVTASLAGCVALSDLSPLSGCLSLRWLDLRGCAEVRDLSALSALPELAAIATAGTGVVQRSLPAGLRRRVVSGWSPDLESASRKAPRAPHPPLSGPLREALLQIRSLLRSNDTSMVEQALELIFALDEPTLYDALLRGSGLTAPDDDGFPQLRLSGPFAARNRTDGATRRMRWALLRVLAAAPPDISSARFRSTVEALGIDCPLLDVHDLSAFSGLRRLSLRRVRRWRRAELLATMTGLEELIFHNCTLPSPPHFPPSLKGLHASGVKEADLGFLAHLDRLEEVELVQVSRLESLDGLPASVRRLDIRRAEVLSDVSALGRCDVLEQLSLSGCVTLEALDGLSDRRSLRVLQVRQGLRLARLDGLSGCDALEEVDLAGCVSLRTLDGLQDARGLRSLTLRELPHLSDIDAVAGADLVALCLEGCSGLRGLAGLSGSRSLRTLELSTSQLTSLSGLEGLADLQQLRLTGCAGLTDLRALSTLPALASVSIRGSERLTDLSGLPPLRELVLSDIGATDLSSLPEVGRLIWDSPAPPPLLDSLPASRLGSLRLKRALVDPSTLSAALAARVRWVV